MGIVSLLERLSEMNENDAVVLKNVDGEQVFEAASILGKLSLNKEARNNLLGFLSEIVLREAGANAADQCEQEARAFFNANGCLTAGYCLSMLRRYALTASATAALEKFIGQIPEDVFPHSKFTALLPHYQVAVMLGVQKGLEVVNNIAGLYEIDSGTLKPGGSFLAVSTIQKAQKTLVKTIGDWQTTVSNALPLQSRKRDFPLIKRLVFKLLLAMHAEPAERLLEILTTGPLGDIFRLQGASVKVFTDLGREVALPSGIDAKGPEHMQHIFREFLFSAACQRIKNHKESVDMETVRAEAEALLLPDVCSVMARLLVLFLNDLLRGLPAEKELNPKAAVGGFDAQGFHVDFVRDCIAKRYSFSIESFGKVPNALEREAAVARGMRDMEFHEWHVQKMINNGKEEEAMQHTPPAVRTSAAMTEEDLKAAQKLIASAIPARDMRMAISAIANQASLALFEAFYCKEPATGVNFEIDGRQVSIGVTPRGEFSITAELYCRRVQSIERHGIGEEEMELNWPNLCRLQYIGKLKHEKAASHPSGKRWEVLAVNVEVLTVRLTPPR